MKRWIVLIACILGAATLAYTLTRRLLPAREENQLTWLRREFHLSAEQSAAIAKLQDDYQPICAEHCRLIREANQQANPSPAEITRLEAVCRNATMKHLRDIAALMPAGEGARFLVMVESKLTRHDHEGPLGLK